MALLGSIIWIVIGIVYVSYKFYKEEPEDFKGVLLTIFAFVFTAAPFCIGNYLTESEDETLQKLGWIMY